MSILLLLETSVYLFLLIFANILIEYRFPYKNIGAPSQLYSSN